MDTKTLNRIMHIVLISLQAIRFTTWTLELAIVITAWLCVDISQDLQLINKGLQCSVLLTPSVDMWSCKSSREIQIIWVLQRSLFGVLLLFGVFLTTENRRTIEGQLVLWIKNKIQIKAYNYNTQINVVFVVVECLTVRG